MKAIIDGNTIEEMNFWYFKKDIERKAKKAARAEKIAELVSEGVEKQLAADMVDCGLV